MEKHDFRGGRRPQGRDEFGLGTVEQHEIRPCWHDYVGKHVLFKENADRRSCVAQPFPYGLSSIILRATALHGNRYYLHVNSQSCTRGVRTSNAGSLRRGRPGHQHGYRLRPFATGEQRDKRVVWRWLCSPTGVAFIVPGKYTYMCAYIHTQVFAR